MVWSFSLSSLFCSGDVGAIFACVAAGQAISGFMTPLYNKIYIAVSIAFCIRWMIIKKPKLCLISFAVSQKLWFLTVTFSFVIAQHKSLLRRWIGTLAVSIWWLAPSRLSFSSLHHTLSSFSSKWKPPLSDTLYFSRKKTLYWKFAVTPFSSGGENGKTQSQMLLAPHILNTAATNIFREYILRLSWLEYFSSGLPPQ